MKNEVDLGRSDSEIQDQGTRGKDLDSVLSQQDFERQAKFNVLNDEEKNLYAEAMKQPDIVTEMRSKLRNVGYCCLHEAEIRSIRKILAVIDSG